MYKPFGNRATIRINKQYLFDKKKPVLDEDGHQRFDLDREGTVLVSNISGLKKGSVVVPIIRGGVPISQEETKKYIVLVIDENDIYAVKA